MPQRRNRLRTRAHDDPGSRLLALALVAVLTVLAVLAAGTWLATWPAAVRVTVPDDSATAENVPPIPAPAADLAVRRVAHREADQSEPEGFDPAPRPAGVRFARGPRERDFYAEFVRRGRARPDRMADEARSLLTSDAADAAKVAMLRALLATAHPDAFRLLGYAVQTIAPIDGSQGESVPSVALRLLCERARASPAARACLGEIAFQSPDISPALRCRAAACCAATATEVELPALRTLMAMAPDADVRSAAEQVLAGGVPLPVDDGGRIPE